MIGGNGNLTTRLLQSPNVRKRMELRYNRNRNKVPRVSSMGFAYCCAPVKYKTAACTQRKTKIPRYGKSGVVKLLGLIDQRDVLNNVAF